MERKLMLRLLIAAMVLGGAQAARAQAVQTAPTPTTNPGLISNEAQRTRLQIEQRNDNQLQGPAVLAPPVAQVELGAPGGPTIFLKSVSFEKSELLSKAELDAIVAEFIGKKVDAFQLQRLLKAVNDLYAKKGVITALAFLPKQNLQTGLLRIGLVEGHLGEVQVSGNNRLPKETVVGAVPAQAGAVVDVPRLGRDVAWFNRTHNAQLQASLQPGTAFGLTNIALSVIEPPQHSVQAFIDNQGVKSVGELQAGVNLQEYGLLGWDDKFTLYSVNSRGSNQGNVAYNIPFNPWGGRIGASYAVGRIHIIQGPFKSLNITGHSGSVGVNASQPVYIDQTWQALVSSSLTRSLSASSQDGTPTVHNWTDKVSVGVTLGYTSDIFTISVSPNVSFARTTFRIAETKQSFRAFSGSGYSTVKLPFDFVGTAAAVWSIASSKIIPGDQLFQIGGPTTVRGYPTDGVAGYAGYYSNFELHHSLSTYLEGLDVFAFYDRGSVYSTFPNRVDLNSVGAGASWDTHKNIVAELSAGVPITKAVDHQPGYSVYFRLTGKWP